MIMPGDTTTAFQRMIRELGQAHHRATVSSPIYRRRQGMMRCCCAITWRASGIRAPYAISHIGWGAAQHGDLFHRAITRTCTQEISVNSLSYYGNVLFSTGPEYRAWRQERHDVSHGYPAQENPLSLDNVTIVDMGRIAIPEMAVRTVPSRAAGGRFLSEIWA